MEVCSGMSVTHCTYYLVQLPKADCIIVTRHKFQTNFTLPNPTLTNWLNKMTLKHIYVQYSVPTSLVPTYRLVLLPGADCVSYCTQL